MLYVFLVDTGTMLTFDMNLAMESVSKLQSVISKACHISEDKQVLLISGGESLDPYARVGKYSAGTDTNPIYLFSKTTIEAATPPSPSVHYGSDVDLQSQVEGSLIMPPAYETVVSRTQLAVQFRDVDEDELKACINLVHDQHLQQQGWAAVVANLEDITVALRQRSDIFQAAYSEYLEKRSQYIETLSQIGESLHLQTKIPLLSCLPVSSSRQSSPRRSESSLISTRLAVEEEVSTCSTLFQWINSQDPHHSLQDMVDRCIKAAEQFDENVADTLKKEVVSATEVVGNPNMKEVKGLEDRLYSLDQIMSDARKIVEEQSDMAKGIVQNQTRVSNLRDKSILPDLCSSHKKQLIAMLNNHKKIRDIKKKCRMAKEELAINLHTRLRWVMFVEKKICDVDGKLTIYHESLRRLHKQLDIMRQIEEAPKVYAQLVVEVVRRRMFSLQFMEWANNLAEETKHLHTEEVKRRQSFQNEIGKHFLQSLFQGFEDLPPPFATEAPVVFDQNLPEITEQDVHMLREAVPELQDIFKVPNDIPVSERMSFQTVGAEEESFTTKKPESEIHDSTATSDIDILQGTSMDNLFVRIESSKISLGEQVATCEPSDIIIDSPQIVSSAGDKPDFPIPQSLSETLTQEMSTQVKGEMVKGEVVIPSPKKHVDTTDLLQTSTSGDLDTQRSGESDVVSDKSAGKPSAKRLPQVKGHLTSDTSPEIETSQEFTTADFYFDESMPSSMIDSPPNKSATSEKAHSSSGSVKAEIISNLEKELASKQQVVDSLRLKLKTMNAVFTKDLPTLKEDLVQLRGNVSGEKSKIGGDLVVMKTQISEAMLRYSKHIHETSEEKMKQLQDDHDKREEELKMAASDSQKVVDKLKAEIETARTDLAEQKSLLEKLELKSAADLKEFQEKQDKLTEELKQKHLLEMELEVDRLREELNADLLRHETTIQTLEGKLQKSEENLEASIHEKETAIEELNKKFQMEKEEIKQILEDSLKKEKEAEIERLKAECLASEEEKLRKLEEENCAIWTSKMEELKQCLHEEKDTAMKAVNDELEQTRKNLADTREKLEEEKEVALKELKEAKEKEQVEKFLELEQRLCEERERLVESLKPAPPKETSDLEQQTEETSESLRLLQEKMEEEFKLKLEAALQEEKGRHEAEVTSLGQKFDKEKEDSLSSLKTSITAEKQIQFNEAVEKVSKLKDKTIEQLRQHVDGLKAELEVQKNSLEKVKEPEEDEEEKWNQKFLEKEQEFSAIKRQLEDELALSRQQITQYQQQLLCVSVASSPSPVEGATCSESVYHLPVAELEKNLKSKDVEIGKLQEKIMEMSMSASTRAVAQDKVSITSCKIGDLVLLCLDEPHDQYIVFTVRTTLHFLHSDCLEVLGLKTAPGELRKSWVLAEITDKEYCQAKKPQNRFKVPVGTKFYRVKAKPWLRDISTTCQPATPSSSK